MDLDSHFLAYILKTFAKSFWIWDHYEDVLIFVHVPVEIRVVVAVLKTDSVVHFSLESVEDQVWVIASAEGSFWCADIPVPITVGLNKQFGPYVKVCCRHCICWWCCDGCPNVGTGPCVSFLYTVVNSNPLGPTKTKVSKKGRDPCWLEVSVVKYM